MIHILYKLRANIHQTQLGDFIGNKRVEIYKMWDSKDYRLARKNFFWLSIRRYRKRIISKYSEKFNKYQRKIVDYLKWVAKLRGKYLYRFPRIKIPRFEDYAELIISKKEWDMFLYFPKFDGHYEDLFEFNDFSFFDNLQERLEEEGVSFKKMFITDVFKYEMLRVNLGFKNYSGLEKMSKFMKHAPLFSVTHDYTFFPTAADMSYVMKRIPAEELFAFFQLLVKDCIDVGIIIPRILIWDGQFIRSNSKNNKDKNKTHITILTRDTVVISERKKV